MNLFRAHTLVLKKYPLGETDALFSLFSKEFGRIRAVAKGALRPKSRWMGIFETANIVEAVLYEPSSRKLYRINQATVIRRFKTVLSDYNRLQSVYEIIEVLQRFTPDGEPQPDIFHTAVRALSQCDDPRQDSRLIVSAFHLRFLSLSGYAFRLNACVQCGKSRRGKVAFFSAGRGGVICRDCLEKLNEDAPVFSRQALAWLETAQTVIQDQHLPPTDTAALIEQLKPVLHEAYHMHFGDGLRSWDTMEHKSG